MKVPDAEGVPLMVIVLDAKAAVTPAGRPVGLPMPVAPVVAIVIAGLRAVLIHNVGVEEGVPAVLGGKTFAITGTRALEHSAISLTSQLK